MLSSFDTERTDGRLRLHLWPAATDLLAVDALYGEARRLLHRQRLTLTTPSGYVMTVEGVLRLVAAFLDPDDGMMHGICEYAYTTEPG